MHSFIDHIVIGANTVEEGTKYVHRLLGVAPVPGGRHLRMGTHNCLLRLGPTAYLEVIARDPASPEINRPRWFDLDKAPADREPKLLTWVVRTAGIRDALKSTQIDFGVIETMERENLQWLISVKADGSMPLDGIAPALIEWRSEQHPATRLPDSGCSLVGLEAFHPEATIIKKAMSAICLEGRFNIYTTDGPPRLIAHIETPSGLSTLTS